MPRGIGMYSHSPTHEVWLDLSKYALRYFVALMYGNEREIRRAIWLYIVTITFYSCAVQMASAIRVGKAFRLFVALKHITAINLSALK